MMKNKNTSPLFHKVTIYGIGLIGGSLGLALKEHHLVHQVMGFDQNKKVLSQALEYGAIDSIANSPNEAAKADVIILATPVETSIQILNEIKSFISPGTIVSDVGSTKAKIVEAAKTLLPGEVCFIGGHPMAGSEKIGINGSDPYLFENAFYILTPNHQTNPLSLARLEQVIKGIGAKPYCMDPKQHDQAVAAVSHIPHLLAAALVNFLFDFAHGEQIAFLAAGGFRDTTRIAAGDPVMWRDIFLSNDVVIEHLLDQYKCSLEKFSQAMKRKDGESILQQLQQARNLKLSMPVKAKGYLPMLWEITVAVPDKPGVIAGIANSLGTEGVNIADIEIMRIREGEGGSIRLGFATEEEQGKAVERLRTNGYTVIKR